MTETTARVRILVAIDDKGRWVSAGHFGDPNPKDWILMDELSEVIAYRWIEADVLLPVSDTLVEGSVQNAE